MSKEIIHYVKQSNGRAFLSFFNCKKHVCISKEAEGIMFDIPIEFAEQIATTIAYENEIEDMAKQYGEDE